MRHRLPPAKIREAVMRYAAGETATELAEEYGYSKSAMCRLLEKFGLIRRRRKVFGKCVKCKKRPARHGPTQKCRACRRSELYWADEARRKRQQEADRKWKANKRAARRAPDAVLRPEG